MGRRLQATNSIDHGRFMRRQYRGIRTSATVLFAFIVAWFPYCLFLSTIFILMTVDIDSSHIRLHTVVSAGEVDSRILVATCVSI